MNNGKKIKILVLGCNGFLGSNFTKKIIKNNNFIFFGTFNKNINRIKNENLKKNFENYNSILHKKKLVKILNNFQPEIIINFIGNPNVLEKSKKKHETQNFINLKNTLKSISLSKTNIKHIFNIGTSLEYKHSLHSLKETDALKPLSEYAKSKVKCHNYGVKWGNKRRVKYTTIRTFNVIGKDKFRENIILKLIKIKNNEKFIFYQFNAIRDFIFIDDFINIFIKLILNYKKITYDSINIGSGIPVKISYLIKFISNLRKKNLTKNIIIQKKTKINSNFANINRLKKIINFKKLKTIEEITKKLLNKKYPSLKKGVN